MKLTDTERFKIAELQRDPVYMGILQKLADHFVNIPVYSPKSEIDAGSQYELWVNKSGVLRGVQLSIQTLGYENDRGSSD